MTTQQTPQSELDSSLGFNLARAALLFRRELLRVLAEDGLQPEQWQVLLALGTAAEPLTQQQIAELILADKHAVSRMLARMERDGWVERLPDPDDARSQRVVLTPKASTRRPQLIKIVRGHFAGLLTAIPDSKRIELVRLLRQLRVVLRDSL